MKPMTLLLIATLGVAGASAALSASPRDTLIQSYADQAGGTLSAEAGKALFLGKHSGGKPETPSCTTCHTNNPKSAGQARTGKVIEPMAVSANPNRFTDPAKVEKWFRRNCSSVLGRECTAQEKGDILTYLSNL